MTLAWRRRARPLLGTLVEIAVRCESDAELERLVAPAFERVQRFHDAMSFHDAASDVRAIAAAPAGSTVAIGADTRAVLALALAIERESEGVFDVAVGRALVERGLLPRPTGADESKDETAAAAAASLRLERGNAVTVLLPVWIDLGGIAKGAAVDAAIEALRLGGAAAAIVNAGGDIVVLGDEAQPITVRGPGDARIDAGSLADGAIATSGPFDAIHGGALVHRRGAALWADRSVSVVAPRCAVADALTKVVAVLGQGAATMLARYDARAFSVDAEGRIEHVVAVDELAARDRHGAHAGAPA